MNHAKTAEHANDSLIRGRHERCVDCKEENAMSLYPHTDPGLLTVADRLGHRSRSHGNARLLGLVVCLALVPPIFGIAQAQAADSPASVDAKRMSGADRDGANWLSYGRTY